jgi:two-component system response regulator AtoC
MSTLVDLMPEFDFQFSEAGTGVEAVKQAKRQDWDMVLMDVRMPEMSGIDALVAIKEHDPRTFVVLMTAHSNLTDAIQAIKVGAYDYLEKPVAGDKLRDIVKKAWEAREMVSTLAISNPVFDDDIDSEVVGRSEKMSEIFDLIGRLTKVDTTVLIRGEKGTGKELVARAIHYNSPRKDGPFVTLDCSTISEDRIESELFGHEKDAFEDNAERKIGSFQMANKGTLFLDEVAELKPDMQVKLLRALQEKTFVPIGGSREVKTSTRVIATSSRNLEKMIEDSQLRMDLFYGLNVMPIFVPPLRERREDIVSLVDRFIRKFEKQHNRGVTGIGQEALNILTNYNWPGNIRELQTAIEHAFIKENSQEITKESLPESITSETEAQIDIKLDSSYQGPMDFERFKGDMEKEFIVNALKANKGRINKTVAHANIPKNTLLRKIKKYGINVKEILQSAQ